MGQGDRGRGGNAGSGERIKARAAASREATKVCKERVYEKEKKNAFRPSTSINRHFWNPTTELVAEALKEIEKNGYYRM